MRSVWLIGLILAAGWIPAGGTRAQTCQPRWTMPNQPPGENSPINVLTILQDESGPRLYAGGRFTMAGTLPAAKIARWNGQSWATVGKGLGGIAPTVHAIVGALGMPAFVYVAGEFTVAGGIEAQNIALWTGSEWSPLGLGVDGPVYSLAVFDAGGGPELFAGGMFTQAGGENSPFIAKWNGANWSPVGSGVDGRVLTMVVHDDGAGPALFAAGDFTMAGGQPAERVARWNGADWSAVGDGLNNTVFCLMEWDPGAPGDPLLVAGGSFVASSAASANRVAIWNGTAWWAAGTGLNSTVRALTAFDDGTVTGSALYVGGSFTMAGGQSANRIARWNGTTWSTLAQGVNDAVFTLAAAEVATRLGPSLYVGGSFSMAGGSAANYVARWDGCYSPPADFSGDGRLNLNDFGQWVGCMRGPDADLLPGCNVAEIDGDGDVDVMDFAEMQILFRLPPL